MKYLFNMASLVYKTVLIETYYLESEAYRLIRNSMITFICLGVFLFKILRQITGYISPQRALCCKLFPMKCYNCYPESPKIFMSTYKLSV